MSETPKISGALSADRLALLDKILRKRGIHAAADEGSIPRRPDAAAPAPLSFAQQRFWFLERLGQSGMGGAYHIPGAVRMTGRLDVPALARALAGIGRRHEVLRTRFALEDGQPVQIVEPEPRLRLPLADLTALPPAVREAEARRLGREEVRRPFDLEQGPLLRVLLLRLGTEEHLTLFTLHHIVSDGWSRGVLERELAALYGACAAGRAPSLPDLPLQYADFAVWQRRQLQGEALEKHLGWWRERLAGAPAVLELPADRRRPAARSSRGASRGFTLPESLSADLRELARRTARESGERVTLFMVLLAGFAAVLGRWSGEVDVVVGTPIANRRRPELEGLIGCFVNTLALRVELAGDPPFAELLARTARTTLGAYEHQDLPFEKLVEELAPERAAGWGGHQPIFQVALALQSAAPGDGAVRLPGLELAPAATESGTAKFDLTLSLNDGDGPLWGFLEHSLDLFEEATARRLLAHLETFLAAAAADPGRRLSELPLLTEAERRLLLTEAGEGAAFPVWCLHERFREWAERTPDAVAAVSEDRHLSYGALERRAWRLAGRLAELGVGPEVVVGLCLDRSLEMVTAILGVLAAGGAYLPLDPAYPAEHLAYVLGDAGVWVVVTRRDLAAAIPSHGAELVFLEADAPGPLAPIPPAPEHLAYVIYTSGSTGRPKGVLIPHAHAARLLESTRDRFGFGGGFGFGPGDVWTLFHSYAFDFSVWELWGALVHGGRLVVVPHETTRSPGDFLRLLEEEGVTVLNQTPSAFRQLAREEGSFGLPEPLAKRPSPLGGGGLEKGGGQEGGGHNEGNLDGGRPHLGTFHRPVFIVGSPRSGTSLLFETLAQSPDLWTIGGESHAVIESIGALHPSQRGWSSNRLTAEDATADAVALLTRSFRAHLRDRDGNPPAVSTGLRFLEKTPKNSLRIPFLAAAFPDALFVYLYRDPRETLSSMLDAWRSGRFVTYPDLPGWPGPPWSLLLVPGWRELAGRELAEVVTRQWSAATSQLLDDLEALPPGRWCVASYDRLVAEPQAEIGRLCEFIGAGWDRTLTAPLPLSRHTLTSPEPEKWRHNGEELKPVMSLVDAVAQRARDIFANPPAIRPSRRSPAEARAAKPDPNAFRSVHAGVVSQVLERLGSSLLVSTYQSGRLIAVRSDGGQLNTHFRAFPSPMGIAVRPGQLILGTQRHVWEYRNQPEVGRKLKPPGKHDACFLPRKSHVTGDIRVHELVFASDPRESGLWIVNTRFSCLASLDGESSFVPRWRPPFVSALAPEDRCHLNGLAIVDGRPRFVTALGATDSPQGWRQGKATGGVLLDVPSGEIVARGLSMPHSPRWYADRLWVLESGKGEVGVVDLGSGKVETVARLDGFTRGLAFAGPYAFVGLSQVRESNIFGGIPLTERVKEKLCGVWVLDIRGGRTVGFLRFEGLVQEIFDIQILPGIRYPEIAEPDSDLVAGSFTLPQEALAEVAV